MLKKIWVLGLLSLAGLAVNGSQAHAFLHHLFKHCCGGGCGELHLTCRPYNAFTPICWGNLTCDGVCPNPCAVASGCCAMPSWGQCMPMPVMGGLVGDPACVNMLPPVPTAAPAPMNVPGATAAPNPAFNPAFNQTAMMQPRMPYYGYGYGYGVQPVNYHPGYYNPYANYYAGYGYNPAAFNPYQAWGQQQMPNPYYGYGYGYGQQR